MKYPAFIVLLFGILLSVSCKNTDSEETTIPAQTPAVSTPATTSETIVADGNSNTDAKTNSKTVQLNTPSNIQPIATGKGLNPEHGKPGHRCDIPVGTPLDSKPTQPASTVATQPVVSTTPTQLLTQPAATTTSTSSAGLNPEHGKPGHRCDIAVGAPLDSKPVQQTVTTQPSVSTTPATQKPLALTPLAPSTAATGDLNPEHGKPGHRCDIAVGAPLNSKPKQ